MKFHASVNRHLGKMKFDWHLYRIFMLELCPIVILKRACAHSNSNIFHPISKKLHDSVDRNKEKIKFDWSHTRIVYARFMSLFKFKNDCAET